MMAVGLLVVGVTAGEETTPARSVTYVPAAEVAAAFAEGRPLVEVANYKIHASRRVAAGEAEVHAADTDVIYVLSGTATLVTGGRVVGGRELAPEEIRGTAIAGGETRTLSVGDVLVVPNGTPHWFKAVPGPMTYYVVKVRSAEAQR